MKSLLSITDCREETILLTKTITKNLKNKKHKSIRTLAGKLKQYFNTYIIIKKKMIFQKLTVMPSPM